MIARFTLVQIDSSSAGKPMVIAWNPATYEQPGLSTAHKLLGVTMTEADTTELVAVMKSGYLRAVTEQNSESWAVGDILWAKNNGSITKTRPAAPLPLVFIGTIFADEGTGGPFTVDVNVHVIPSLGELSGVSVETPADLDVLIYKASTNVWEPRQIDHGTDLAGLADNDHPQYHPLWSWLME
jgi:hypothetical protein